jgi:hypothetical protein
MQKRSRHQAEPGRQVIGGKSRAALLSALPVACALIWIIPPTASRRMPAPEIAYWERGEWWLAGDARPRHADAMTVASERLMFKPQLAPVA